MAARQARVPRPTSTTSVVAHIKRWRCIRWRGQQCSQIISAHVSTFHSRISGWFVHFWLSLELHYFKFWRVLTAARQQWTPDSDSELDFDGFWPWSLVKTDILQQLWAPETMCSSSWLGCPMSTVIRLTLTALLLWSPWQQRFFDIQTSANLRKFVLSFVSSISLKTLFPVIPFPSERVFNTATFMPMLWRFRRNVFSPPGTLAIIRISINLFCPSSGNVNMLLYSYWNQTMTLK